MTDAKYGAETRTLLAATGADSVVTIVIGGIHGHGFATAARGAQVEPSVIAGILRRLAVQMDHAATSGDPMDITVTPSPDH
jgi:hypothetical protein